MPQLEKLLPLIAEVDPVEREELLFSLSASPLPSHPVMCGWAQRVISVDFPSINATPDVCGGEARLIRTRIPVWVLERMRQLGVSEIDILRSYPTLRAVDLVQAWSYASRNRAEIAKAIHENEEG